MSVTVENSAPAVSEQAEVVPAPRQAGRPQGSKNRTPEQIAADLAAKAQAAAERAVQAREKAEAKAQADRERAERREQAAAAKAAAAAEKAANPPRRGRPSKYVKINGDLPAKLDSQAVALVLSSGPEILVGHLVVPESKDVDPMLSLRIAGRPPRRFKASAVSSLSVINLNVSLSVA
jgi:small-conductance mechanosensitive channel